MDEIENTLPNRIKEFEELLNEMRTKIKMYEKKDEESDKL